MAQQYSWYWWSGGALKSKSLGSYMLAFIEDEYCLCVEIFLEGK